MHYLSQSGKIVSLRPVGQPASAAKRGGGRRGVVDGFSRASRRRLLALCNRLDLRDVRAVFVTLTFAGLPKPIEAKAALKRLIERWRRRYGDGVSAIWRVERQARGSLHFHLMVFGLPFVPQADLQSEWTECTREARSIVHITMIKSHRKLINYVAKYIAKVDKARAPSDTSLDIGTYSHAPSDERIGRHWGIHNADHLPYAVTRVTVISGDMVDYLIDRVNVSTRGRARGNRWQTVNWWCDDAFAAWQFARHGADEDHLVTPEHIAFRDVRPAVLSDIDRYLHCLLPAAAAANRPLPDMPARWHHHVPS